jgi:hypothetical protein
MGIGYSVQYDRMQRWHNRFGKLDRGRPHDMPSEDYLDEIYAFFQNCYHLKDWIKNDGTVTQNVRDAVETYINSNRSLRLCADICNALKHLSLRNSRSGEEPEFGTKRFKLNLGRGQPTISLKCEVETTAGKVDAYQLASDCMDAWKTFLLSNGLQ